MVTVSTVVLVQAWLGLGERATGLTLAAFGAGSVAGATAVLKYLSHWFYRRTVPAGGGITAAGLLAASCCRATLRCPRSGLAPGSAQRSP